MIESLEKADKIMNGEDSSDEEDDEDEYDLSEEEELNDLVYIDNKPTHRNKGRVIGFTKQKT